MSLRFLKCDSNPQMHRQPQTFQAVVFALIFSLSMLGCDRKNARERVLDAVNATEVEVANGQAAILRLSTGYAALVPNYVRHNEITYRVFFSSNGVFNANNEPVHKGVVTSAAPIDVQDIRVFVGYGGENITSVMLDPGDNLTAIAVIATNDFPLLNVSQIEFRQGKPLNPQDLMKAIGEK
jgi:hypothetical protein